MGIFSRSTQEPGDEEIANMDLPDSSDIKANPFNDDVAPNFKPAPRPQPPAHQLAYGIEDAIRLMKSLPRDNNEVVVTVVKRTLESTNISVEDIIEDAKIKEERIREEHRQLETEIQYLQEEIAERSQLISELLQDLKETSDVRQRLQLATELTKREEQARVQANPEPKPANPDGNDPRTGTGKIGEPQAQASRDKSPEAGKTPDSLRIAAPKSRPDPRPA